MRMLTTAIGVNLLLVTSVQAQSLYTESQLNQLRNRNSAAAYSSQRVRSSIFNSAVPQYAFSDVNRGLYRGALSGPARQKPFSHVTQGPSVTPYLGLLSENPFTSTTTNYFTNVRPQIEQQRMNDKLQQQNYKLQKQLNSIAARPPYDPTGSEERAPTGHAAVYMNHGGMYGNGGGYYPQVEIKSVRGR